MFDTVDGSWVPQADIERNGVVTGRGNAAGAARDGLHVKCRKKTEPHLLSPPYRAPEAL